MLGHARQPIASSQHGRICLTRSIRQRSPEGTDRGSMAYGAPGRELE